LIKATRFDRYQGYLAIALSAFRMSIVISAVHICIITAFSEVPINDLICRSCLDFPKKDLYLPPSLIKFTYCVCCPRLLVSNNFYFLLVLLVPDNYSAQLSRVLLFRLNSR